MIVLLYFYIYFLSVTICTDGYVSFTSHCTDMALRTVNRDPTLAAPGVREKFDTMMDNLSNLRLPDDNYGEPEFSDNLLKVKQRYPIRKGPPLSPAVDKLHGGKAFNAISNSQIHKFEGLHQSTTGHC